MSNERYGKDIKYDLLNWDPAETGGDMGLFGLREITMACNRIIFARGDHEWAVHGYSIGYDGTVFTTIDIAGHTLEFNIDGDPLATLEQRTYDWLLAMIAS